MIAAILIASTIMNLFAAVHWNSRGTLNALCRMTFISAAAGTAVLAASRLGISI